MWDLYLRTGKFRYMYDVPDPRTGRNPQRPPWTNDLEELEGNGRTDRVLLLLRPWEDMARRFGPPIHRIVGPDGRDALWICQATM